MRVMELVDSMRGATVTLTRRCDPVEAQLSHSWASMADVGVFDDLILGCHQAGPKSDMCSKSCR